MHICAYRQELRHDNRQRFLRLPGFRSLANCRRLYGRQVALVRWYSGSMQQAIQALESDVVNPRSSYHEMTAVLDKVAAGQLLARRQDVAANQLLSHALEQLLVRGKSMRDTEAATMNMRLGGLLNGRAAGASLVRGASNDLRAWRQP